MEPQKAPFSISTIELGISKEVSLEHPTIIPNFILRSEGFSPKFIEESFVQSRNVPTEISVTLDGIVIVSNPLPSKADSDRTLKLFPLNSTFLKLMQPIIKLAPIFLRSRGNVIDVRDLHSMNNLCPKVIKVSGSLMLFNVLKAKQSNGRLFRLEQ